VEETVWKWTRESTLEPVGPIVGIGQMSARSRTVARPPPPLVARTQPTSPPLRSLSVTTGRPGHGAVEPRGRGTAQHGGIGQDLGASCAHSGAPSGRSGNADLAQRHTFPAPTDLQPQRRVAQGRALLIVGGAGLAPAWLGASTLQVGVLVEPAIRLAGLPDNAVPSWWPFLYQRAYRLTAEGGSSHAQRGAMVAQDGGATSADGYLLCCAHALG
jgi:hypothetical protein